MPGSSKKIAKKSPGTHMPPSSCGPTFSYIFISRLQL